MLFTSNVSGYEVQYDNKTGIYLVIEGGAVVKESKSYNAIERFISTGGEGKEKEARLNIPIIYKSYSEFKKAVITSIAERDAQANTQYVWIVMDGKRRKESITLCYEDTQENQDKTAEIAQLRMQIREMHESICEITAALVHVTLDEKGEI